MRALGVLFAVTALACAVLFPAGAQAGVAEGKKAFEARKCASCHQVAGPASEKTIKDQLAKKGPELWYAGSKFKAGFLERWLSNPQPIRPLAYNSVTERNKGDHQRLAGPEAKDVAVYLMSLKSTNVKQLGIQPADTPKGRVIFIKKQSCYGCHTVINNRGKAVGGLSGPALANAYDRLNPDWVYAYLSNPKAFKPVKMMPVYAGVLNDAEMKELAAYVGGLR
ncbi:MAG TPA: hypothetical protein DDW94_07875 [Deltaproteobacteria bacterium]|nr:MAG: hypothetical protein A2Z79_02400 [Deltaproteobacteria bacterium GWA2_55_82]OGQ62666.1 MAG: hypothetical protein A3I81_09220 [Deltaproteobacteria bacterium RIFCSPLOWO2_02_FULL_55_12]OIJ74258.1 MAG: hypothetical protein A2V21_308300 [Deltaproteobacteria bacterium GWC2_55_46]HBG46891.1 hypothetical protein [Deltaproteobacteria bacterium]HCY11051.1 hypothetical protein [Deltaproteobacteria bacterium]